jgi:hypothetical protein
MCSRLGPQVRLLESCSEATRAEVVEDGSRMRFCCMPLESAALQEVEAWPPKRIEQCVICPGRLRHSSPWRRESRCNLNLVESTSLLVLLVNATGWDVYGMSACELPVTAMVQCTSLAAR